MKLQLVPSRLWMAMEAFTEDMPKASDVKIHDNLQNVRLGVQAYNNHTDRINLLAEKSLGSDMHYMLICAQWWNPEVGVEVYFVFRNPTDGSYENDDFEMPQITRKLTSAKARGIGRLILDDENNEVIEFTAPRHESEGDPVVVLTCATRIELTDGWTSSSRKQTVLVWARDKLYVTKALPPYADKYQVKWSTYKRLLEIPNQTAGRRPMLGMNKNKRMKLAHEVPISDKERG